MNDEILVCMTEHPSDHDWYEVKRRALVTMGYTKVVTLPDEAWKHSILEARHSPIRRLFFSFDITCPYWVSVHLCRHLHAQPYVKSQRNDRQDQYDRNSAPQDAPVDMIWDMNGEELMTIMNKRLCNLASEETRYVVKLMRDQVLAALPEFKGLLVPACAYNGGVCHEIYPCKNE
jgi:thymidylate synthase ThyX